MTKRLAVLWWFLATGVGHAALLTNFTGSYAQYVTCSALMGTSKCFKLYCDPLFISSGQITAFVEVPDLGPGMTRFSGENVLTPIDPYTAQIEATRTIKSAGRERFEAIVSFETLSIVPNGPVTLFEIEIHDAPTLADVQLGLAGVEAGFEFNPAGTPPRFPGDTGDFVTLFRSPPDHPVTGFVTIPENTLVDVSVQFSDFDSDGDSDGADFLTWQRNFGRTAATQNQGDVDADEVVNGIDFNLWKNDFGAQNPPAVAVPEPAAAVLACCGLAAATCRQLSRRRD